MQKENWIPFEIENLILRKQFSLNNIKMQTSMISIAKNCKRKSSRFYADFSQLSKIMKGKKRNKQNWNLWRKKSKHNWKFKKFTRRDTTQNNQRHWHKNNKLIVRTPFHRSNDQIIMTLGTRMQINKN